MVFFNVIQPENGTQSKVVSRQTRMSRVIRIRVRETGEGRVRESRGLKYQGIRLESKSEASVVRNQINQNK